MPGSKKLGEVNPTLHYDIWTVRVIGRLKKVTQLIDKASDGLTRLNDEEGV